MRRISFAAALLCVAGPALAYSPCAAQLQAVLEVQSTRDAEEQMRADYAAKVRSVPIGTVGVPPDRDPVLLVEHDAAAAIAVACTAAAAAAQ